MIANHTDAPVRHQPSLSKEILPLVLLVASVAIAFFFTYGEYYSSIAKADTLANSKRELENRKVEIKALGDLKNQSEVPAFKEDISRYASKYSEDGVLSSLFAPVTPGIVLLSVGMDKGEKLPNGLSMANVNVSLRGTSQGAFLKYLAYLTGDTGTKRYVIKSLNFPYDSGVGKNDPFQVSINLGMYHYSK